MNLQEIAIGTIGTVASLGLAGRTYYSLVHANTENERIYSLAIGGVLTCIGMAVSLRKTIKGFMAPNPPTNPPTPNNPPARSPSPPTYPQHPRIEADEIEEQRDPNTGSSIYRRIRRYRQNP